MTASTVASRVGKFIVNLKAGTAEFAGFFPHNEVKKGQNVRFITMHGTNLVLDRAARLTQTRADGAIPGTQVPLALLSAKDIVRATFLTGGGVEEHRQAISAESRLARKALKAVRAIDVL